MSRPMSVHDSIVIAAPPSALYALISDPTAVKRWSPENTGAVVGTEGAQPLGATFTGTNKRGSARWTTRCTVISAEPDTRFAFRVDRIGYRTPRLPAAIATWEYRLVPVEGGTEVTETWTDNRRGWPDVVARVFDRVATGTTFARFQQRNIATSLSRLKALVEQPA
jgi:uncharacterized protein YndB with AHSA1/START domain